MPQTSRKQNIGHKFSQFISYVNVFFQLHFRAGWFYSLVLFCRTIYTNTAMEVSASGEKHVRTHAGRGEKGGGAQGRKCHTPPHLSAHWVPGPA